MKKILSTILALAACTTLTAQDFKITHGPWLCDLTSDGVTVVWATSKPALSWVEVAEDDGRSFYAAEHEHRYETVAGRKQARKTDGLPADGGSVETSEKAETPKDMFDEVIERRNKRKF